MGGRSFNSQEHLSFHFVYLSANFWNYIQTKEVDMRVRLFGHSNPRTQRAQVN
jgi:hypothetical protein